MSQDTRTGGNNKDRVVDFGREREKRLDEKRKNTQRLFFRQLLGVYSVTGNSETRPIEMVDVSEDGCSFLVPFNENKPWPESNEPFPIRIYFTQDTYIPIHVTVRNATPHIQDGTRFMRYGCSIDQEVASYEAYKQFIRFMKSYSEHAHKDSGGVTVFYL